MHMQLLQAEEPMTQLTTLVKTLDTICSSSHLKKISYALSSCCDVTRLLWQHEERLTCKKPTQIPKVHFLKNRSDPEYHWKTKLVKQKTKVVIVVNSFTNYDVEMLCVVMVALHSRCGHYIFILWFLLSFFFFSSPNLSGRRLDVYHTSTHGVALVQI